MYSLSVAQSYRCKLALNIYTLNKEGQEFAQTKKNLLILHLIFESMQKLHDTLFFYFLDRGTYF